jgi:membrane-associated protein
LPVTLMLVAAGSFVELGEMKLWEVIVVGSGAAVLGDQIGYALGRWGGHHVLARVKRRRDRALRIEQAAAFAQRWGGAGIFFSRWLVTPLGPWINLTSGMTAYGWVRFLCWDLLGEVLWVSLYVLLGRIFSGRVQALVEILGNLAWVIVGLTAAVLVGWQLLRYLRPAGAVRSANKISRLVA